ncbi:MAG: hypothetical protein IJX19_03795 [Clostridia bacterium]|nr:hypothetical protein [Clostridia bacterium]
MQEKSAKTGKKQEKKLKKYYFCAKRTDVENKGLFLCVLHNFVRRFVEDITVHPPRKRVNNIYFLKKSIGKRKIMGEKINKIVGVEPSC